MRKRRKWLATLMTIAMLVTIIPAGAFAQGGEADGVTRVSSNLDISKSKTAENLDPETMNSKVTLSLPSESYSPSVDVVMVIDVSSSMKETDITEAKAAANAMCDELTAKDKVDVNVGVVTFDKTAHELTNGLVSIAEAKTAIDSIAASSDTNMMAGLMAGKAMLDAGTSDDKYMVLMSDGIPIYWMENGEPVSKILTNYRPDKETVINSMAAGTEPEASKNEEYLSKMMSIEELLNATDWDADSNDWKVVSDTGESFNPDYKYTNIQKATYKTAKYLQDEILGQYKMKMVAFGTDKYEDNVVYKYGEDLCDWIGEQEGVSYYKIAKPGYGGEAGELTEAFTDIANEMIYVVDAGSTIVDVIGSGQEGDESYNFDFVDNIDKLEMTVQGENGDRQAIAKVKDTTATLNENETSRYNFGDSDESLDGGYPYVLHYYQNGQDGNSAECFVLDINVPIAIDNGVQLSYEVHLMNPSSVPGTHGTYDRDGSNGGTALYTNVSATLNPVDTNGIAGNPEEFGKPTVSYTVEEPIPEGTIQLQPADITIYTGGDGYESAVDGSDDTELGTTSDGLPEPGFYVTLPEDLNDWMIKHADDEDKTTVEVTNEDGTKTRQTVVDLSDYLTFTYKDDQGNNRLWKLERYDNTNASESMAFSKYIYRILPAQVGDEEIPIRLQFTDQDGDITTSDDFTINLDGLYQEYKMTIYPGALTQQNVEAVLTAGKDVSTNKTEVVPGELVVRGVVSNAEDPTTEITDTTPTKQVEDVTAQVPAGTIYKINESELAVENQDAVRLLVDSVVPDSNNTLQNAAVSKFDDITAQHECEMNYLDLVDTSNGNAWVTASNDVTVHWPIPADATDDSEFYIVHYEGLDRNDNTALDDGDYTQELYSVENDNLKIENGNLTFTVDSFSPFALFYTAEEPDTPGGGGTVIPSDPDDPDPDTPDLNTDDHYSYIVGYPEDYRTGEATDDESLWPVKPQGNITRAEVATIFYRLLTNDARDENWTTSNSFTDVSADSWYNTPVSTLSAMGLIEGYEDGSFRPDNPITRAEFAAIAGRFFTDNDAIYEPGTFSDIEGAEWFADAVQAAKDHDIIGGYPDGSFKPNNPITRAEACSIVNRTTKRVPDADHLLALDEMRNWPDNADTSAWYYADMQEATNGHYYDYVLDENDEIVREEWTSERAPIDWEQVEEELEASH